MQVLFPNGIQVLAKVLWLKSESTELARPWISAFEALSL